MTIYRLPTWYDFQTETNVAVFEDKKAEEDKKDKGDKTKEEENDQVLVYVVVFQDYDDSNDYDD